MGYGVHLANPHGNDWGHRRVKNDERDARDLADLLAPRTPGRGLDRPAQDPRAPRDGPLPAQAVQPAHRAQGPGPRRDGQERDPAVPRRHVGPGRHRPARLARAPRRLRQPHRRAAGPRRAPTTARSSSWTATSTSSSSDDAGYNAVQAIYGVGPRLRRSLRGRDRRRDPLRLPQGACAHGPGSPPSTASPTPTSTGDGSPSRDRASCAGRPSRRWPATTAERPSGTVRGRSPNAVARPGPTWRLPAKFSRSSTTACETARSAVSQSQEAA